MELLLLLINLAGSAMLLLWAVRMVRTGVERINGGALRRAVRRATHSRLSAAGVGALVATMLQSSTAVALLAAGFAASGLIASSQGLALVRATPDQFPVRLNRLPDSKPERRFARQPAGRLRRLNARLPLIA